MPTKNISFLIILIVTCVSGCKVSQTKPAFADAAKYKVGIFYPNGDGKTFDMTYYEQKHMPMVAGFLGKNLKLYEIDKGKTGRTASDKLPFLAVGFFYIDDIDEYNKAVGQNIDAIRADFKNFTNIQPVIQISETKQVIIPR